MDILNKLYIGLFLAIFVFCLSSCRKKIGNEIKPQFYIEYEEQKLAEKLAKKHKKPKS